MFVTRFQNFEDLNDSSERRSLGNDRDANFSHRVRRVTSHLIFRRGRLGRWLESPNVRVKCEWIIQNSQENERTKCHMRCSFSWKWCIIWKTWFRSSNHWTRVTSIDCNTHRGKTQRVHILVHSYSIALQITYVKMKLMRKKLICFAGRWATNKLIEINKN